MTVANPLCSALGGSNYLAPGTQVTVDVNVTNAPLFNAYEFSLFYDPTNLTLASYNVGVAGSPPGTMFNNAFIDNPGGTLDNSTAGTIRAGVVNLASGTGNGTVSGNGVLAFLTFNIKGVGASPFVFAAGTCCPAEGGGATAGDWTRLVLGNKFTTVTTSDGYFQNNFQGKLGPVAAFTWSPASPVAGQSILFNATGSYDPETPTFGNANITTYLWDFGDGATAGPTNSPTTLYTFKSALGSSLPYSGNFSVLLTVTDHDNGFIGMVTHLVEISQLPFHRLSIGILTSPSSVLSGANITVTVYVTNSGTFDETYNLTVTYGPPTVLLETSLNRTVSHSFGNNEDFTKIVLGTKGLSTGTFEIDAVVTDPFTSPTNTTAKTTFHVTPVQNSPLLYTLSGIVGVGVVGTLVALFLRRRSRIPEEE